MKWRGVGGVPQAAPCWSVGDLTTTYAIHRGLWKYCPTVQIDLSIELKKNHEGFKSPLLEESA